MNRRDHKEHKDLTKIRQFFAISAFFAVNP